jgi:hypothetical protein
MKTIGAIIGGAVFIGFLWLILWVPIVGFHYETSRGEHTGYITAVERNGIFFKTGRAYVKTDTQSSQEDSYCFIDKDIEKQLQEYSTKKIHANIYFFDWFSTGIANCGGNDIGIIYKIEPLTK